MLGLYHDCNQDIRRCIARGFRVQTYPVGVLWKARCSCLDKRCQGTQIWRSHSEESGVISGSNKRRFPGRQEGEFDATIASPLTAKPRDLQEGIRQNDSGGAGSMARTEGVWETTSAASWQRLRILTSDLTVELNIALRKRWESHENRSSIQKWQDIDTLAESGASKVTGFRFLLTIDFEP